MSLQVSEKMFTQRDLSSLVSVSEEVLLASALLTSWLQNNSAILKSLLLEHLELETKSGLNGSIPLLNQPESILEEIPLLSFPDV